MKATTSQIFVFASVSILILAAILYASYSVIRTFLVESKKDAGKARSMKKLYDAALAFLQKHPEDPHARLRCLTAGRRYYEMVMPDTIDVRVRGLMPTGVSNPQNNAAAREARIQADIEARIGHLKLAKSGT